MPRTIGRTAAAALIAGLLGAAWIALLYAWHPSVRLEFDRDLPRNVSGIYPSERADDGRLTFAWTGADAVIRLPGLDRGSPWILDLRIRGGRQAAENADYIVVADGVDIATARAPLEWSDVRVIIPPRPERRGLTLGLRPSRTFVPGPGDKRSLGFMLDRLVLTPERIVLVPRPALLAASVASAAMGAAIALLGVTAGSAIGGAVLVSAGASAVIGRGFGPFTEFPSTAVALGCWIAGALASISLVVQSRRARPLRNTARFAAAFSAAALFLKLLVVLHPDMPIGDAMFHAHRFQAVLGGTLYFTSIAPGGYAFPYPPGLYVFAAIFSGLVERGSADMTLLRIVTCTVDAAAGLLLYRIVEAGWRNRLAAAAAVALYNLIPVDFAALTTGNLTNAFAQSVAVGALGLMSAAPTAARHLLIGAALALVLVAAYLSHTSTVAIVFAATIVTAGLFALRGGGSFRRAALIVAAASCIAAVLAIAIYYSHFVQTYRAELARIGHETAANASDAGGRTIGDRLRGVPYAVEINLGLPLLCVAAYGAFERFRRRAGDGLDLATAGWAAACLLFLSIGILTPVDMRYYLAALPALGIAAGYGAAAAWNDTPAETRVLWRVAAGVSVALVVAQGVRHWWGTLG